ncbi:glycosyltransferase family 2 protein [Arthrospiribacter ruber]|uniref:Glycosyltransferase family 2 protein n=1 Tax=Arthrospiribacter ruber TaxID=2487934 RepID=A0A951IVE5_9BACT|nr:glycosyltransferase family 2 protein [Arthrospiribacter ruber]MBW3466594.1 glycosyltransferase family 2 protein [Arthrospiribacter ruber]
MEFKVSVIIPVYNAEEFLENAVESALRLREVGEVILVEDGSNDNSLKVCQGLSEKLVKVNLFQHPNGTNRGAGASRNLGISKANYDFISFLDADDWYLANRFEKDKLIFQDPNVFASYSLSSIQYLNGKEELFGTQIDLFAKFPNKGRDFIYQYILENDLILGHTNCNTFRKTVFDKIKGFDERLVLHQDTELWNRIAKNFTFYPGNLQKPISVARRHSNNRITHRSKKSQIKHLLVWMDNIGVDELQGFEKKAVIYHLSRVISNPIRNHFLRKAILHGFQLAAVVFRDLFIYMFYKWGMKRYNLQEG